MAFKCPGTSSLEEFNKMVSIFGDNVSYYLWHMNNGQPLYNNPDGTRNTAFDETLEIKEINGNEIKAMKIFADRIIDKSKSQPIEKQETKPVIEEVQEDEIVPDKSEEEDDMTTLTPIDLLTDKTETQLEINFPKPLEKGISLKEVKDNLTKKETADSSTNLYSDKRQLTLSEYEAIPFKESQGISKSEMYRTKKSAESIAEVYGGIVINAKFNNGDPGYKVVVKKPIDIDKLIDDEIPVEMPEHIAKIVERKQNMANLLLKKLSEKSPRAEKLRAQVEVLKSQISRIKEKYEKESDTFTKTAINDSAIIDANLKEVKEKLQDEDLSDEALLELADVLVDNSYAIKGWVDISELIDSSMPEYSQKISELAGAFSYLSSEYNRLVADVYSRYVSNNTFQEFSPRELLVPTEDISEGHAKFLSIGESEIPLLQTVDDLLKSTSHDINEEWIEFNAEIERKKQELIENTGLSEKEVSDLFIQEDDNGNWTGNYIGKYSQKFFDTRESLYKETQKHKKGSKSYNEAWKNYFKWIKDNSTSITKEQLQSIDITPIETIESMSREAIRSKFGKFSKEQILKQKELLNEYNGDELAFTEALAADTFYSSMGDLVEVDGKLIYKSHDQQVQNDFNHEIDTWVKEYNPYEKAEVAKNKSFSRNNSRYKIFDIPNSKWTDTKYEHLTKPGNEKLLEFYDFMVDKFKDNNNHLPYFNELQSNYLPELQKSFVKRTIDQKGIMGAFKYLINAIKRAPGDEVISETSNEITIGNKTIESIPVYMMDNRLAPESKESNVFNVLSEHTKMTLNHKYKSQIEPMVTAATDLLETVKERKTVDVDGKRKSIKKFWNRNVDIPGRLINAKASLKFTIDAALYNKTQEVEGRTGIKYTVNDESMTESQIVERKSFLTKQKNAHILREKNPKKKAELKKEYDDKINLVGKIKMEVTGSGLIDTVNTWTYLKQLGFPNFISPTVNSLFGIVSNLNYAAGGVDLNERNLLKAEAQMHKIVLGLDEKFGKKVHAFMKNITLIGDIHDTNTDKDFTHWVTIMQTKAEFINQGSLLLGVLYTQKLKDINGNEVRMFDAFNEENGKLVWNEELMGKQEKVPSNRIFNKGRTAVNMNSFERYLDAINKQVHGDYKNVMMVKKGAAMRAVMLYKRWIPQAVSHRFGKKKFNKDLLDVDGTRGRYIKGRYITLVDAYDIDDLRVPINSIIKTLILGTLSKKFVTSELDKLSEVDRVNMLRNFREVHSIVTLIAAVALLKALADDDDETMYALNIMINTLTKTSADMSFFLNPNSAAQIFNNVIPAISTLNDFFMVGDAIFRTIKGDAYYKSGPWKDSSRIGVSTLRAFPGPSGGVKIYNYGSRVFEIN